MKTKLLWTSTVMLLIGWILALFIVGADTDQGNVYRIIFVHVPCAWNAFLWVITGGFFALRVLLRRGEPEGLDQSSHSAILLGTIFSFLALATGSIWGRPTWGVWWDWDPRLTSTLIMFLVSCGYLLMRGLTPDVNQRRNVSAFVAILASINVPLVYYSVNIWRSVHQPQTFTRSATTASTDVTWVLWYNVLAMTIFAFAVYKLIRKNIVAREALHAIREG